VSAVEHAWRSGDRVVWPNGVEGVVQGVDFDDCTLLDECGAWVSMYDVDLAGAM
jgi:hypothetical protein